MHPQDGRVVSNFIIQALQDKDITVYGKGDQTRSFCYVDDLIDGILALMNSYELLPVNLGNPAEFTILELAEMVIKLTNSKSSIVFNKLPADDPKQRKPNINSAMTKLKWEPKVPLEMGLTKTIEYFDDLLKKDKV
jgi:UDP-glucuronate decarboxylase